MLIEEGALVTPDAGRAPHERLGRPRGARAHAPRRAPDRRLPRGHRRGRASRRRRARHRHRQRRAGRRRGPRRRAARLRGRGQRHRGGRRARVRGERRRGPRDAAPRVVAAHDAAGTGHPAGRRGHRQRAARGGDPRDHARRPLAPAGTGRSPDPARADAAGPPGAASRSRESDSARSDAAAVERWRELYGIDFTPLLDAAIPGPTHTITEGEVVATWPQVGPPVELATIDLATFTEPTVHASSDLVVEPPGIVNAVALTFRAGLFEGSSTRWIRGPGLHPAGRHRCGCCPTRSRWAMDAPCASGTAAASPAARRTHV